MDITVAAPDCNEIRRTGSAPMSGGTKNTLANAIDDLANEMAKNNCPELADELHEIANTLRNS